LFEVLAGVLVMGGFIGFIIWSNKRKEEKHYQEELRRELEYYEDYSYDQGCEID